MKTNIFNKQKGKSLKVAIVQSRFNFKITEGLLKGAIKALANSGVFKKDINLFTVPGSFEIPIFCQALAKRKKFSGIIALGAVVRGQTDHYKYISRAVSEGIMRVSLDFNIPIAFGVITARDLKQAKERSRANKNNKGREAALALLELINNLKIINPTPLRRSAG